MKNLKKTMIFMVSILLLITGSIIGAKNVKADNEIPWTFYQGDLIRYYFEGVYQPITPDTVYVGTDNYNYYRKMRIFNVNFPGQTSFHKTWNSDESYKLYIGLSKSATNASPPIAAPNPTATAFLTSNLNFGLNIISCVTGWLKSTSFPY